MLNLFPLQFLAPLAYAILRFCVGFLLIRLGILRIRYRVPTSLIVKKTVVIPPFILLILGLLEIIAGVFIFLGLYTQLGALLALLLVGIQLVFPKRFLDERTPPRIFFALLFCVALSLCITGAGAFSFDLPI